MRMPLARRVSVNSSAGAGGGGGAGMAERPGLPAGPPAAPVAIPVAVATATPVAAAVADPCGGGAEVAELVAQLGVEVFLEAHGLAGRRAALGRPAAAVALGLRRRRGQAERHLAAGIDVVDPDLDLVAEVEHVLDPVDALPAPDLGDVEQAVTAR